MIYQWHVCVTDGVIPIEGLVLGETEEQAKQAFEEQTSDWATGPLRYRSITKTGMVLVHESQVSK